MGKSSFIPCVPRPGESCPNEGIYKVWFGGYPWFFATKCEEHFQDAVWNGVNGYFVSQFERISTGEVTVLVWKSEGVEAMIGQHNRADTVIWHEQDAAGIVYQKDRYCLSGPWYDFLWELYEKTGFSDRFAVEFDFGTVEFYAGDFQPLDTWVKGFWQVTETKTLIGGETVFALPVPGSRRSKNSPGLKSLQWDPDETRVPVTVKGVLMTWDGILGDRIFHVTLDGFGETQYPVGEGFSPVAGKAATLVRSIRKVDYVTAAEAK